MDPVIAIVNSLYSYGAENTLLVFGVASGVLSTFAYIPYILDTLARRTHPQRASWLIWSVLGSIAFFSQVFEGASSSLWFAAVQVTGTIIVFALSIRSGTGAYLSRSDYAILFAASVGLVLWYFTENAGYALAITISISLLGGLATAIKAYKDPESETLVTWVVSLIASVCAVMSVGRFDPVLLAYPLYLLTLYTAFVVAILMGRARRGLARSELAGREFAGTVRAASAARPLISFAMVRSGLRTTADTIIIAAALVVSFNWFNSNGNTSAAVSFNEDIQPVVSDVNKAGLFNSFVSGAVAGTRDSLLKEPDPVVTKVTPLSVPPTIVVVMQSGDGSTADLQVLAQSDPVAIDIRNRIEGTFSSTQSDSIDELHKTVALAGPFLSLDEDDPFAKLTVSDEAAAIVSTSNDQKHFKVRLLQGELIQALETNGEWFLARTNHGIQGYVHHSMVEIRALAALSR